MFDERAYRVVTGVAVAVGSTGLHLRSFFAKLVHRGAQRRNALRLFVERKKNRLDTETRRVRQQLNKVICRDFPFLKESKDFETLSFKFRFPLSKSKSATVAETSFVLESIRKRVS